MKQTIQNMKQGQGQKQADSWVKEYYLNLWNQGARKVKNQNSEDNNKSHGMPGIRIQDWCHSPIVNFVRILFLACKHGNINII